MALTMTAGFAQAVSRSQIIAAPAVVAAAPTAVPGQADNTAQRSARAGGISSGIIIVIPAPLPPLPPNFCNRGNSGGVSRC